MIATAKATDETAPANVLAQVASLLRSGDVQTALVLSEAALETEEGRAEPALDDRDVDAERTIASPPLNTLSFIEKRAVGGGYNYWANVPPAASYTEECEIGQRLAEEFIQFIGAYHNYGNATLLGSIVVDMEKNGAGRGLKIGFLNTINKYAMGGAYLKHATELEPEHPWQKCRRLGRALADALKDTGEDQFAYVTPAESGSPSVFFGHLDYSPFTQGTLDRAQDFSAIFYDLVNLVELAEAALDILRDLDYTRADGTRNTELDRVSGLQHVLCSSLARLRESASVLDGPTAWVPARTF
ncbi:MULTISPECIES: hypothetical protein [Rhizobium]|uniref:hypothetical protein n=1 Tax=Rhizobium TaxID=379 RepID=UPI001C8344F2|nr:MULTISPECIES: hypothetical protein [Rhizobium]MBX4895410.1 hypothetical protein [Rhizobium bangladeshense]MBX5217488.1 hypothetical protein [Rhizobium sp. NLR9a]